MNSKLKLYKSAKDSGNVSYGDKTKPMYVVPHETRGSYVMVGYPQAQPDLDPATLQPQFKTEEEEYSPVKLHKTFKDQKLKEKEGLEKRLQDVNDELLLIDEFIDDTKQYMNNADSYLDETGNIIEDTSEEGAE